MNIDLQAREIQPLRQTLTRVAEHLGGDKAASRYLEATIGAQPAANFHYRPTWQPEFELFDTARTAIKLKDWYVLKDPRQFYYANWTMTRARQQDTMESNFQFVESKGMVAAMSDAVREQALTVLMPLRHAAWGANMNNASVCAYGYGTAFTAPAMFHAMDNLGVAQYLTRLGLALGEPEVLDVGKQAWLNAPVWQELRRLVEDTLVVKDPFELFVAQNLAIDGLLYPLVYGSFVDDHLTLKGATAVAMLTSFMSDWHAESARWIDAVVKTAAAESDENRALLSKWATHWVARAQTALTPIAQLAMGEHGEAALADARTALDTRCRKAGLAV